MIEQQAVFVVRPEIEVNASLSGGGGRIDPEMGLARREGNRHQRLNLKYIICIYINHISENDCTFISENERLCLFCNCNKVENEVHFCFIAIIIVIFENHSMQR